MQTSEQNMQTWGQAAQPRAARSLALLRWLGVVLILETGLIHYLAAVSEYDEAPYMGYLFVANFLGALLAAYGILRRQLWGWMLGAVLAGASIGGYIYSRTVGMPAMALEEWVTPYGVAAGVAEGLFLALIVLRPWRQTGAQGESAGDAAPGLKRFAFPALGALVLLCASFAAYRWDADVTAQIGQHQHVGSLDQVCSTPVTSAQELREKYGLEVGLVASTAMNSFVDVRLKVVDADKASSLLVNQTAILVGQQELLIAPHIHSHAKPKNGRIISIFYPNRAGTIRSGTEVSLVFGKTRTEAMKVR